MGAMARKTPGGRKARTEIDPERGQRIHDLLEGRDVKQVARDAGLDPSSIYRWMKGKTISDSGATALARALGTSRSYLLTGEHDPREQQLDRIEATLAKVARAVGAELAEGGPDSADAMKQVAQEETGADAGTSGHG